MFYKKILLNIFSSKQPCKVTVFSCDDEVIEEFAIQSYHTKICIRTKGRSIKLFAKYKSQTIYQTVSLYFNLCQSLVVNFAFDTILPHRQPSFITLSDRTYGFPIANAILNFKQKPLPLIC